MEDCTCSSSWQMFFKKKDFCERCITPNEATQSSPLSAIQYSRCAWKKLVKHVFKKLQKCPLSFPLKEVSINADPCK